MESPRPRTPYVLLTRLFLRQFLENDLISPDADRSQLLAVVGSIVVCLMLFISTFLSFTYVMGPLTPGQAAVLSLNDKFLYFALAMIATALMAATQWDALTIDPRDAAILEPLPVPPGVIRRAKLSAVAILGAAVAIAVNAAPSVVFPALLVFPFRELSVFSLFGLMVTHAAVGIAAAVFGYLAVIAVREAMAAVLGPRWFARVSPWGQGALIVVLGGSLLLLPPAASRIAQRGFDGWRPMAPPMWFVGANDYAVGGVVFEQPRRGLRPRLAENDRIASALYQSRRTEFPALARRAWQGLGVACLVAALGYLWNARRLPSLAALPPSAHRRRWRLSVQVVNALLVGAPAARAGFYFTLAAMWRSNTHRLTLACAAAAGFAMAIVALSNANLQQGAGASPRLLAMQPLLYGALLVGFRHVIRVPAELRANWGFQLAWRGRERAFVYGVKCAAMVALVLPAIAILLPLFISVLGVQTALLHAVLGLAGAIVLLEGLMVSYDKVPFTCTYLPNESMKGFAPILAFAFLIGASVFARMQYHALQGSGAALLVATLVVLFVILRMMSLTRPRLPYVEFDEAPATFQRLGLDM